MDCPIDIAGFDPLRLADGYRYDLALAERPECFFRDVLVHTKSSRFVKALEPFQLEPWQTDITRTLFGWVNSNGHRRFRTVYVEVPRKNGKTSLCAGLALYALYCDGEDGAECYCAACDRNQASLLFGISEDMIKHNPVLNGCSKTTTSKKEVRYKRSVFRALTADSHVAHGYNPHLIIADEVHAWPKRDLWDVLLTGTGARAQPIMVAITTAGWDRLSLCWELHQYAEGVRDGTIDDPTFLPVLYGADSTDDWRDEATWRKANPNYGVSVNPEYLKQECQRAVETPAYENTFRRLHLNQWTSQNVRWIQPDRWRDNNSEPVVFSEQEYIYAAFDLSTTTDLTAWCIIQPTWPGYKMAWHFWLPAERAELAERRDKVPYSLWAKQGLLTITPGSTIDYSIVEDRIVADCEKYEIRQVGYDPYNAEGTRQRLAMRGISLIQVPQGFKALNEACKEFEGAVLSRVIQHGGNPILEWMIESVDVKTDINGNIRPIKPETNAYGKRIDGISAAVTAISIAIQSPYRPEVLDYYESNELEAF